jgi:protein-S-isoprenylcysteine O-methyltransferase Ste14
MGPDRLASGQGLAEPSAAAGRTCTGRARLSQPRRRRVPVAQINLVVMPAVVYYLYFGIGFNDASLLPGSGSDWAGFFRAIAPTVPAALVYLAWFAFQVALERLLPGRVVQGMPLTDGTTLPYRINGLLAMIVSLVALAGGYVVGWLPLAWLHANLGSLITVVTIFSFAFSVFVWWWGRNHPGGPSRTTGSFVRDYFYGVALNPRLPPVSGFDLKWFCECRPGLIGWLALDLGMIAAQYERHGEVSAPLAIVVALQVFYVANNFWNESLLLTTIDIQQEKFGWMLVFGDLVLVPMTYCLQAYYLIDHFRDPSPWWLGAVVAFHFLGYAIFVLANRQKDRFRKDPDGCIIWGRPARYMETQRGKRLLLSGFWGLARHMNYLGDWMIALSWGLLCGFGSLIPYFYPAWFALLLITRERRDDRWCARKYGADWDRYKEQVPWRIIPRVY